MILALSLHLAILTLRKLFNTLAEDMISTHYSIRLFCIYLFSFFFKKKQQSNKMEKISYQNSFICHFFLLLLNNYCMNFVLTPFQLDLTSRIFDWQTQPPPFNDEPKTHLYAWDLWALQMILTNVQIHSYMNNVRSASATSAFYFCTIERFLRDSNRSNSNRYKIFIYQIEQRRETMRNVLIKRRK